MERGHDGVDAWMDRMGSDMTESEAFSFALDGCDDDSDLAALMLELDDYTLIQVSMFDSQAKKSASHNSYNSLSLLAMQQYYFFWCLYFVLAGNNER